MPNTKVTLRPGTILLAEPFLKEPEFSRAAVLICHIDEEGALGLVLNKPIGNPFEGKEEDRLYRFPFFSGGPVDPDHLFYLHSSNLPGALPIRDGIFWQGDYGVMLDQLRDEKQIPDFRFFLGYSGWEAGQLENEIKEDAWLIYNGPINGILNIPHEILWKKLLQDMGPYFRMVSNFPLDPNLN